ncbi:PQQ-dependent sugar dehydrogenase [Sphingomonas sp. MMS24-J13]|uniref:PQQ-dependent sugar dehydrogenase n=1 Tax=Sphingomonas sp. MMS24-J13 TaxID=3238686 RepID=UPI00384E0E9A
MITLATATALMSYAAASLAQTTPAAPPPPAPRAGPPPPAALGDGPWDFATEKGKLHVTVVAKGLDHPWAIAFLPNGDMLVTERVGRLRVIRKGVLDPNPIAGTPDVEAEGIGGMFDIALHPKFAKNHMIYIAYAKPGQVARQQSTLAVMRARWDGGATLSDVQDIFVADAWYGAAPLPKRCCGQGPSTGSHGGRLAFDREGYLYITSGDRNYGERVQDPSNDFGKIIRLYDNGGIPQDNPFVGKPGYRPEIWTIGHRNPLGLVFHPVTHQLWESEFGPRGGDEVNIIKKGRNYGWIDVTQGAHYNGEPAKGTKNVPGMEDPILTWAPSINPGNLFFYEGSKFPGWKGNLLMPDLTHTVLRVTFDAKGQPIAQERMMGDLKQRLRDIKMGPDGFLYITTDEKNGAVLRIEPGK